MKKIALLCAVLVALFPFAVCAETETVSQMTLIVKMPDVIREGKYSGEIKNGIPHGYGIFESANSEGIAWHYIGEWADGEMAGQGGCYWDSGRVQVGTYAHNEMICGNISALPSYNAWVDYRLDEDGCMKAIEYRTDGTVLFDGCVNFETGLYHKGTVYTKDGKVFFSGEIGEGFNWELIYIE